MQRLLKLLLAAGLLRQASATCQNTFECTWAATGCPNIPNSSHFDWSLYDVMNDEMVWDKMYDQCAEDFTGADANVALAHRKSFCCGDDPDCNRTCTLQTSWTEAVTCTVPNISGVGTSDCPVNDTVTPGTTCTFVPAIGYGSCISPGLCQPDGTFAATAVCQAESPPPVFVVGAYAKTQEELEYTCAAAAAAPTPRICEKGGGGLVLPLARPGEQEWPNGLRIVLYMLGLGWCFVGVAIISDVFMSAIEKVTSKKKRIKNKKTGRFITVLVWNETVSNLTLMALGSSAPEIMLSLIELLNNGMYTGDLGPSTIIGSAAFNLLCISAVCVYAIESPDVRFIKEVPVYMITASCSVFAYLWLLVILQGISVNVIDLWEGVLTLLFFPLLVYVAFLADKGMFSKASDEEKEALKGQGQRIIDSEITPDELAQIVQTIKAEHPGITDDQVMKVIEGQYFGNHSRAFYRHAAISNGTGGKKVKCEATAGARGSSVTTDVNTSDEAAKEKNKVMEVGFSASRYAVLENCGSMKLHVNLSRPDGCNKGVSVKYKTRDGSAKAPTDYEPIEGVLEFGEGETDKVLEIKIIDDATYEEDEEFFVDLFDAATTDLGGDKTRVKVYDDTKTCTVLIIDDDEPGILRFSSEVIEVPEAAEDRTVSIMVERFNGSSGTIGCKWYTEGDTAVPGYDYEEAKGTLEFPPQEQSMEIQVTVKSVGRYENTERFRVILCDPYGGAKFDKETDGGEDQCVATVTIKADDDHKGKLDRMMSKVNLNMNKMSLGHSNWKSQFLDALSVSGGDDDEGEEGEEPSKPGPLDYIMHFISIPWKLLFACVPPTDYCDGWLCFVVSLMFIGVVTAVVGDMASLLGCVMNVPDEITAITFVALGTSLPDTFASKTAATMDPYADASIGNVTGSNSVNVFLGLGIPWTLGAIFWAASGATTDWQCKYKDIPGVDVLKGGLGGAEFIVPSGSLWFNLMVFCVNASCALGLLALRRKLYGGELGGPKGPKIASSIFLVFQWFIYIGLSSWWAIKELNAKK